MLSGVLGQVERVCELLGQVERVCELLGQVKRVCQLWGLPDDIPPYCVIEDMLGERGEKCHETLLLTWLLNKEKRSAAIER